MTYKTITLCRKVGGCGTLYALFLEDDGAFYRLQLKGAMSRSTPCGEAWLSPMAKILTFAMRRSIFEGSVQRGIIKQLRHERCNNCPPNKDHVVSCADAIGSMVEEYLRMKQPHLVGSLASDYQEVQMNDHATLTSPGF